MIKNMRIMSATIQATVQTTGTEYFTYFSFKTINTSFIIVNDYS